MVAPFALRVAQHDDREIGFLCRSSRGGRIVALDERDLHALAQPLAKAIQRLGDFDNRLDLRAAASARGQPERRRDRRAPRS